LDVNLEQVEMLNLADIVKPAGFNWYALSHLTQRLKSREHPQSGWDWFEQARHPGCATDLQSL
jgi:hypothetical protein